MLRNSNAFVEHKLLSTLRAQYAEQGLYNSRASVRTSVRLSHLQTAATAPSGLLLSALLAGDVDRQLQAPCWRRRAAGARTGAYQQYAGNVTFRADGGGSAQTCYAPGL